MILRVKRWKSKENAYQESLEYLRSRALGKTTSFITPWSKFNDAGVDGIEWNSMVVIGGRPGSGKTLLKDQIIRESFNLNPNQDFRVLEFQFEMIGRVSAIREFSASLGKTYKELCSAGGYKLNPNDFELCKQYRDSRLNLPIDIVDTPCTVQEFSETISNYYEEHKTKFVVTLDHSILLNKSHNHKDKYEMLYQLGEELTRLKRKLPVIFIILSQLNRNVDSPERAENGKYGNFILDSDIFGGDALLQHADMLIGINRPAQRKIEYYGPERFIIKDDTILVAHFLKCRNGDTRMSFFKAVFENMRIEEMTTPPTQSKIKL